MNHLNPVFVVALVAAFVANAHARPFGPDYGESEICAAVTAEREALANKHAMNRVTRIDDECSTAFVQREVRLPASRDMRPAIFRPPPS